MASEQDRSSAGHSRGAENDLMDDDADDLIDVPTSSEYLDLRPLRHSTTCTSYDISPLVSAVHPCQIYSLAVTSNMKWIFTGGDDGFIRKYDFVTSMNGEQSLTLNQRHGLVDSIQKGGVLSSVWELEEAPPATTAPPTAVTNEAGSESVVPPAPPDTKAPKFSPVFSLAVQSEGVWALAGAESGSVSLYTVRHDEGTCHHIFRAHSRAVSVMKLLPSERGFYSGSWDKRLLLWDLETGAVARDLGVLTSQIASLALQPTSAAENSNILLTGTIDGRMSLVDSRVEAPVVGVIVPMGVPWWMQSAVWGADGTKVYCGRRNGSVDEFDMIAGRLLQNIKMPKDSGPVYSVAAMANARSLVVGSYDNIRLWDLHFEQLMMEAGANNEEDSLGLGMGSGGVGVTGTAGAAASVVPSPLVPFSIVPGHHGGAISNLFVDPSSRYMISASGSRGWEAHSNNTCLFYSISAVVK